MVQDEYRTHLGQISRRMGSIQRELCPTLPDWYNPMGMNRFRYKPEEATAGLGPKVKPRKATAVR